MRGMSLLSILAVVFALVLAWQCVLLIQLGLSNLDTPKTPSKIKSPENILAKVDINKGQQIAGQVCAGCHSPDGNSIIPANPILAGQHAKYITKQLMDYKLQGDNSAKRNSPVMTAMVAPLTPADMMNLGAYYSAQAINPRAALLNKYKCNKINTNITK